MELKYQVYSGDTPDTFYSSQMEPSIRVMEVVTPSLLSAAKKSLTLSRNEDTVTMADFGTADGGVTLQFVNAIIDWLSGMAGNKKHITIIYEDQLYNDFNALFKRVCDNTENTMETLHLSENVHVQACATSMYETCFAPKTLNIAICTMANHWLSQRPGNIEHGIFQEQATRHEQHVFFKQFSSDWKQFLTCRSKELKTGGVLLVVSFLVTPEGKRNRFIGDQSYDIFHHLWKDLYEENSITEDEFRDCTAFFVTPTEEQLRQPFEDDNSPDLGLRLVSLQTHEIIVLEEHNFVDDELSENHVNKLMGSIRPWLFNILHGSLSDSRSPSEKTEIMNTYFSGLHDILSHKKYHPPVVYNVADLIVEKL